MNSLDMLFEGSKKFGIELNETQIDQFYNYYKLLIQWNEKMNLTAIVDEKEVIIKHFLDSLAIGAFIKSSKSISIIDVGTGAGFPGIPIKIAFPEVELTLVDSLQKRINFLNNLIEEIDIKNVNTIHGRAEDLGKDKKMREKFDYCISRAVASLEVLSEYCVPFVKMDGYFISLKGPNIKKEIEKSEKAIKLLGGNIEGIHYLEIPYSDFQHNVVLVKKVKKTPNKFPRNAKNIKKYPI